MAQPKYLDGTLQVQPISSHTAYNYRLVHWYRSTTAATGVDVCHTLGYFYTWAAANTAMKQRTLR